MIISRLSDTSLLMLFRLFLHCHINQFVTSLLLDGVWLSIKGQLFTCKC